MIHHLRFKCGHVEQWSHDAEPDSAVAQFARRVAEVKVCEECQDLLEKVSAAVQDLMEKTAGMTGAGAERS